MEHILMAKVEFKGMDEYVAKLEGLSNQSEKYIKEAIYKGTAVVMNSVKSSLQSIQTDDTYHSKSGVRRGPTTVQKRGLLESLGIADMRTDGHFINAKIGFDGYNKVVTKKWTKGQPNNMVARSVESGTSWMRKQPFMRKAVNNAKASCEETMRVSIDESIYAIMNK